MCQGTSGAGKRDSGHAFELITQYEPSPTIHQSLGRKVMNRETDQSRSLPSGRAEVLTLQGDTCAHTSLREGAQRHSKRN